MLILGNGSMEWWYVFGCMKTGGTGCYWRNLQFGFADCCVLVIFWVYINANIGALCTS